MRPNPFKIDEDDPCRDVLKTKFPNVNVNGKFCVACFEALTLIINKAMRQATYGKKTGRVTTQSYQRSYHTGTGGYADGFLPGTSRITQTIANKINNSSEGTSTCSASTSGVTTTNNKRVTSKNDGNSSSDDDNEWYFGIISIVLTFYIF